MRTSPTFGAYCELAGKVYAASYSPDGARVGTTYPVAAAQARWAILPYRVRLNKAATDSMKNIYK